VVRCSSSNSGQSESTSDWHRFLTSVLLVPLAFVGSCLGFRSSSSNVSFFLCVHCDSVLVVNVS
jgi:hypothetical protein